MIYTDQERARVRRHIGRRLDQIVVLLYALLGAWLFTTLLVVLRLFGVL